jgi:cell division protein FtsL
MYAMKEDRGKNMTHKTVDGTSFYHYSHKKEKRISVIEKFLILAMIPIALLIVPISFGEHFQITTNLIEATGAFISHLIN